MDINVPPGQIAILAQELLQDKRRFGERTRTNEVAVSAEMFAWKDEPRALFMIVMVDDDTFGCLATAANAYTTWGVADTYYGSMKIAAWPC